jgi:D-alanyl-lipoteichoic acid acyltransferase DltB (MBOAT superfamily)
VVSGLRKMAWGMFKKIVIADRLAVYVNQVYGKPEDYSGFPLIMATVLFAFQIYCDFSGYSDIALGSARVMGFDLMKNFNRPYFSKSISEFWRRWHISLSTWFRDYLYIPMGGNKVGKGRWYFNLFFTFLISGFWHGASWNYVIWGSLHGFYLIMALVFVPYINPSLSKLGLSEKSAVGAWFHCIWTFALACFAWVFFRATSFHDAVYITSNFFTDFVLSIKAIIFNTNNLRNHFLYVEISKFHLFIGLAGIFILLFMEWLQRKGSMQQLLLKKTTFLRWSIYLAFGWYFLLFGMFGSNQQFTYFQF